MSSRLQQCFQAYIHYSREQQLLSPQGACSVHMERRGNPQQIVSSHSLQWKVCSNRESYLVIAFICWILVITYSWCTIGLQKKSSWKVDPIDFGGCFCMWYAMQGRKESSLCCETAAKCTPVLWSCGVWSVI